MSDTTSTTYLVHREAFRKRAFDAFHATNPRAAQLIAATSEIVAAKTLFLSGKDMSAPPARHYIGDLIVSFCRTHFIAVDLLQQGDLIEAATLVRKQIELMARVRELSTLSDLDKLIGKTPNVRHLGEQLRRQYAEYSAIAHSATPRSLQLMGSLERDDRIYTPIYPEFDPNAYVTLNHLGWLCFELQVFTDALYPTWFPNEEPPNLGTAFALVVEFLTTPQTPSKR